MKIFSTDQCICHTEAISCLEQTPRSKGKVIATDGVRDNSPSLARIIVYII